MPDDPIKLIPPAKRQSFSRRFVLTLLLLLLTPVAAYALWGLYAQRQLDSTLRAIQAAGESIYAGDFLTPAPPPGRNAAADLLAAGRILETPDPYQREFDRLWLSAPLTPKETAVLARLIDRRREALAAIESAAAKPDVHWAFDPAARPFSDRLPGLNDARAAADLLRADALLAHDRGDYARALARIDQALDLARLCDAQPAVVSHMVAAGISALAAGIAEEIAPDLRVGSSGGVPRARVRATIDRLLDDRPLRAGMRRALYGERHDARALPHVPKPAGVLERFGAKPLLALNADLRTRMTTSILRAHDGSTDWPTFRDASDLAAQFPQLARHPNLYAFAAALGVDGHHRYGLAHYRALADLRLAATALALRCYVADHAGELPPTLSALVPTYLPHVPTDPMLPNNARLRYLPDRADPRIYSVGEDATDDTGSDASSAAYLARQAEKRAREAALRAAGREVVYPLPPGYNGFFADDAPPDPWDRRDTVFHLTRQPRYQPQGQLEWQRQPLPESSDSPKSPAN